MQPTKQQISTNNLIAILSVVTLLVLVACGVFGKSLVDSMLLNNRVIQKKNVAAETSKNNLAAYVTLHDQFQNLGPVVAIAQDALPSEPDFTAIASELESIAGQNAVAVKSIAQDINGGVEGMSTASGAIPIPFTVELTGSYDNVRKMIAASEIAARPLYVTSATMAGSGKTIKFTLSMKGFYQAKADLTARTEVVK